MTISSLKLFKRSNGKWYILFREEGRCRWKSTGASKKQDALKALSEFKGGENKRIAAPLFLDFAKQFLSIQSASLRESTLRRIYAPAFDVFLYIAGNRPLTAYSVRDIEGFKRGLLTRKISPAYASMVFRSVRSAFNVAVRWGMLNVNPFVQTRGISVPEKSPSYFLINQFSAFLNTVQEVVLRDLFAFAALTGMRQGELLNLTWSNVSLERRVVSIESAGRFITKTGRRRTIPLNTHAKEILEKRRLVQPSSHLVFHRNGQPLMSSYVGHKFKFYVRLHGLDEGLKFHSLRHSFATWLVQGGESIYVVSKLLGHSNVRVTEGYAHLVTEELHDTVNKINLN